MIAASGKITIYTLVTRRRLLVGSVHKSSIENIMPGISALATLVTGIVQSSLLCLDVAITTAQLSAKVRFGIALQGLMNIIVNAFYVKNIQRFVRDEQPCAGGDTGAAITIASLLAAVQHVFSEHVASIVIQTIFDFADIWSVYIKVVLQAFKDVISVWKIHLVRIQMLSK